MLEKVKSEFLAKAPEADARDVMGGEVCVVRIMKMQIP